VGNDCGGGFLAIRGNSQAYAYPFKVSPGT
jgi:hypothetical protein